MSECTCLERIADAVEKRYMGKGSWPDNTAVVILDDLIAAKNAAPQPFADVRFENLSGHVTIPRAELARLRAWEKWGREQAKPALEDYEERTEPQAAPACYALAAMPKE